MTRKQNIPKAVKEQCWLNTVGPKYESKCYVRWCKNKMNTFKLRVKPILYYPDIRNTSKLESSNKVIVPSSILKELNTNLGEDIKFPIILKLNHPDKLLDVFSYPRSLRFNG